MPLSRIWTIWHSPRLLFKLWRSVKIQQKFISNRLKPLVEPFNDGNDGSLSADDFKKMFQYYALGVPAILGHMFCLLSGKKPSDKEQWASTLQGALTGLYDDFFDKHGLPSETIKALISVEARVAKNDNERLFELLYQTSLNACPNKEAAIVAIGQVHQAQIASLRQHNLLAEDILKQITFNKGGASLIYYRTAFEQPVNAAESDVLFKLGGIMQLGNDVFDIYKDLQENIHTLITDCKDIETIISQFNVLNQELLEGIFLLPYKDKDLRNFAWHVKFFWSRVMVCLDQLKRLQQANGNLFEPSLYERIDLICDMEKWSNRLRMIRYLWS